MLPQGPYCGSQNHSHPMWPWTDDALSFLAVWLKRLPHFLSLQSLSRFLTIQRKAVQSRAEQRSWAKFLFLSLSKFLFLAFCIWLWSLESRKERFLITRPSVSLQGLCPFLLFFFFIPLDLVLSLRFMVPVADQWVTSALFLRLGGGGVAVNGVFSSSAFPLLRLVRAVFFLLLKILSENFGEDAGVCFSSVICMVFGFLFLKFCGFELLWFFLGLGWIVYWNWVKLETVWVKKKRAKKRKGWWKTLLFFWVHFIFFAFIYFFRLFRAPKRGLTVQILNMIDLCFFEELWSCLLHEL